MATQVARIHHGSRINRATGTSGTGARPGALTSHGTGPDHAPSGPGPAPTPDRANLTGCGTSCIRWAAIDLAGGRYAGPLGPKKI